MDRIFDNALFERLMFTAIVVGILLGVYSVGRIAYISIQLNNNPAVQARRSGELIDPTVARYLVQPNQERLRLERQRAETMVAGGVGMALLGIGWLGYDFLRSRRNQPDTPLEESPPAEAVA